jgi:hypothetical protein
MILIFSVLALLSIVKGLLSELLPDVRATFAIAFVRSSGSTLLCSLLNAQAGIICHDEYIGKDFASVRDIVTLPLRHVAKALENSGFAPHDAVPHDKWFRHQIRDADIDSGLRNVSADADAAAPRFCKRIDCLSAGEQRRQRAFAVGFKQKAELLWAAAPRLCLRWGTKFVFLHRRNVVAHVVSIIRKAALIAELQRPGKVVRFYNNHNNQSRTQRTSRWRQRGGHAATNRGRVDVPPQTVLWQQFLQIYDEVRSATHLLEHFESQLEPACALRIDMEELASAAPAQQRAVLRRVVQHINGSTAGMIADDVESQQRIVKTSPRAWTDGVLNWAELREQIERELPELRRYLD